LETLPCARGAFKNATGSSNTRIVLEARVAVHANDACRVAPPRAHQESKRIERRSGKSNEHAVRGSIPAEHSLRITRLFACAQSLRAARFRKRAAAARSYPQLGALSCAGRHSACSCSGRSSPYRSRAVAAGPLLRGSAAAAVRARRRSRSLRGQSIRRGMDS
jgi:hypothetical protein